MKKSYHVLLGLFTAALMLFASVASASACIITFYQPEVPQSLRK